MIYIKYIYSIKNKNQKNTSNLQASLRKIILLMPLKSVPNFLLLSPTPQVYFFLNWVLIPSLLCVPALPQVYVFPKSVFIILSLFPHYITKIILSFIFFGLDFFFIRYYVFYLIHMEYRTRDFYILRLEADVLLNSLFMSTLGSSWVFFFYRDNPITSK